MNISDRHSNLDLLFHVIFVPFKWRHFEIIPLKMEEPWCSITQSSIYHQFLNAQFFLFVIFVNNLDTSIWKTKSKKVNNLFCYYIQFPHMPKIDAVSRFRWIWLSLLKFETPSSLLGPSFCLVWNPCVFVWFSYIKPIKPHTNLKNIVFYYLIVTYVTVC